MFFNFVTLNIENKLYWSHLLAFLAIFEPLQFPLEIIPPHCDLLADEQDGNRFDPL